jgi:hypothetical protein
VTIIAGTECRATLMVLVVENIFGDFAALYMTIRSWLELEKPLGINLQPAKNRGSDYF